MRSDLGLDSPGPPRPPMPDPAPLDLPAFLARLRAEGELVEVEAEVDPRLEMAEVHRRVIAAGGPAILFKRPTGAAFPAVTNLFGTARRVQLAFGDRPEDIVERIAALPEEALPPTPGKLWAQRSLIASLARVGLRRRGRGPVTEVVEPAPDLSRLPALTTWSRDGGPFVTLPLVLTGHPENGGLNLGMYRAQLFEGGGVGMHAQIGKGGGFHLAEAERLGRSLPVHVHVGGPPALVLAAIAPLPENVPEVLLASLVLGRRLDLCRTPGGGSLPLVARSEVAPAAGHEPQPKSHRRPPARSPPPRGAVRGPLRLLLGDARLPLVPVRHPLSAA